MNLHYETVSPLLKETLQKLVNSPIFKDFTLIGGTCLSLQLGHRRSIDIDLFTDIDYGTMNTKDLLFRQPFDVYQPFHVLHLSGCDLERA